MGKSRFLYWITFLTRDFLLIEGSPVKNLDDIDRISGSKEPEYKF
jgi:hypothetical protein